MTPKKIISLLITILLLQSCTKDVDFNQLDDANINASYIVTLVYFDVEATNFLNEYNEEIELTSDVIESKISIRESEDTDENFDRGTVELCALVEMMLLVSLFVGYGYEPIVVDGSDPGKMHPEFAAALDTIPVKPYAL